MSQLATLRAQLVAELERHRGTSTRYGDDYKNPVRKGYDLGLTKALELIDAVSAGELS